MSGNCQRIFARFCEFSHKIAKVFLGVYLILYPFPFSWEWFGAWVKYWWGQTSGLSPGMGGGYK